MILPGCDNIIPQDTEGDFEQAEGESVEIGNSPSPAPNSGDGISDGPGWEKSFQ